MLEAKRLMLYSNMTVAETGYYLSFSDPAYFSRFFARGSAESRRGRSEGPRRARFLAAGAIALIGGAELLAVKNARRSAAAFFCAAPAGNRVPSVGLRPQLLCSAIVQ